MRVDGNDVLAVYARDARRRGPRTRGRGSHPDRGAHVPDRRALHGRRPGSLPRDDEVEAARAFDPIARLETWLRAEGLVDDAFVAACDEEADAFALAIREGVIATPAPPAEWMFDWTYAEPPARSWARSARRPSGG